MGQIQNIIQKSNFIGQLLLAMPSMGDPRFFKAAIFICAHDEKGAMGLIINHVLPDLQLGTILENLDIQSNIKAPEEILKYPVICGGPVEIARGFLLHSNDFKQQGTINVKHDIHLTGTLDAIEALSTGKIPQHMIFTLGYAGWGSGQLEQEIKDNSWMVIPATPELVFQTERPKLWDSAMANLGFNPHLISNQIGNA